MLAAGPDRQLEKCAQTPCAGLILTHFPSSVLGQMLSLFPCLRLPPFPAENCLYRSIGLMMSIRRPNSRPAALSPLAPPNNLHPEACCRWGPESSGKMLGTKNTKPWRMSRIACDCRRCRCSYADATADAVMLRRPFGDQAVHPPIERPAALAYMFARSQTKVSLLTAKPPLPPPMSSFARADPA